MTLLKLLLFAGVAFLLWRMVAPKLRGVSDADRARRILGVRAGASNAEIIAAHRRLVAKVHPDTGGSEGLAAELNAARDTLLRTGSSTG
ncbi:MAG: J domain-containing protein [Sphingomonadaceae bacterium]